MAQPGALATLLAWASSIRSPAVARAPFSSPRTAATLVRARVTANSRPSHLLISRTCLACVCATTGVAFPGISITQRWYPVVGIDTGLPLRATFGSDASQPFKFDLLAFEQFVWSCQAKARVPPPVAGSTPAPLSTEGEHDARDHELRRWRQSRRQVHHTTALAAPSTPVSTTAAAAERGDGDDADEDDDDVMGVGVGVQPPPTAQRSPPNPCGVAASACERVLRGDGAAAGMAGAGTGTGAGAGAGAGIGGGAAVGGGRGTPVVSASPSLLGRLVHAARTVASTVSTRSAALRPRSNSADATYRRPSQRSRSMDGADVQDAAVGEQAGKAAVAASASGQMPPRTHPRYRQRGRSQSEDTLWRPAARPGASPHAAVVAATAAIAYGPHPVKACVQAALAQAVHVSLCSVCSVCSVCVCFVYTAQLTSPYGC